MDAFFASVEQRDNPELYGKPVIVGGAPELRGVVAAASYEARKFGIRSAMSSARARALCPQAIFLRPRIATYRRVSHMIMGILRRYSDLVEPVSLDEAYLDVTWNKRGFNYASQVARDIRVMIAETTGLTASAGVGPNKFLAKIASDLNKPNGLTVITPDQVPVMLAKLSVNRIPGVGRVTAKKMALLGVKTISDLQRFSEDELIARFGKTGSWFYRLARGQDDSPVEPYRERKSIGAETTFARDVLDLAVLKGRLSELSERVAQRLPEEGAFTVTIKLTYDDFEKITRSSTTALPIRSSRLIQDRVFELLAHTEAGVRPVRLVGISLSHFAEQQNGESGPSQCSFAFV
jgi:DNA polymerase-4